MWDVIRATRGCLHRGRLRDLATLLYIMFVKSVLRFRRGAPPGSATGEKQRL